MPLFILSRLFSAHVDMAIAMRYWMYGRAKRSRKHSSNFFLLLLVGRVIMKMWRCIELVFFLWPGPSSVVSARFTRTGTPSQRRRSLLHDMNSGGPYKSVFSLNLFNIGRARYRRITNGRERKKNFKNSNRNRSARRKKDAPEKNVVIYQIICGCLWMYHFRDCFFYQISLYQKYGMRAQMPSYHTGAFFWPFFLNANIVLFMRYHGVNK